MEFFIRAITLLELETLTLTAPWDVHHVNDPGAWPDTYFNISPDLVAAMQANPQMRVVVVGGVSISPRPTLADPALLSILRCLTRCGPT